MNAPPVIAPLDPNPLDAPPASLEGATPVMAQYLSLKATQNDALLFFRMGDFYELFFDDAVVVAKALNLALTKRGKHQGEEIPMAGVPAHAADAYIAKLIRQGFRVAVCDQLEDPSEAKKRGSKAVVKRDIVRILTPGTLTEETLLEERGANLLVALSQRAGQLALASVELSTGQVECLDIEPSHLGAHLSALRPSETLVFDRLLADERLGALLKSYGGVLQPQSASIADPAAGLARLKRLYGVETLDGFGAFSPAEISSLGLLAAYIELTQVGRQPVLNPPKKLQAHNFLIIDAATRASLEIDQSQKGGREGSLLSVIDHTVTSGGSRLLAARLARPLIQASLINERLDSLEFMLGQPSLKTAIRQTLERQSDMARALSRLGLGRGGPRDLNVIKEALKTAQALYEHLRPAIEENSGLGDPKRPQELVSILNILAPQSWREDLLYKLSAALIDEPPLSLRDGGFIRGSYNAHLNEVLNLRHDSRQVLLELEARLQLETQVPLKIKYNALLGYFIEVSQKQAEGLAAFHLIHRQSLANQVRFTTPELIDLDARIQRAASEALSLEMQIFEDLRLEVCAQAKMLQSLFDAFCSLDVTTANAHWAALSDGCRPEITEASHFIVLGAKHPVVWQALRSEGKSFTPNDCQLDASGERAARLSLVTGPNMAGKSTFLRQNALMIILAQAGLYVPAKQMSLGVVDRLFSRVGAGDDLAQGRSTFMMEMVETAAILSQATEKSFVILDEIGRGTATYDGLAIAWACAEALHDLIKCRCLFATHYHEMAKLEGQMPHFNNLSLSAREFEGELIFLHQACLGAADRSYGVQVAKLAGMPMAVVQRAKTILERLETDNSANALLEDLPLFAHSAHTLPKTNGLYASEAPQILAPSALETLVKSLNPDDLSPKEALEVIYRLRDMV